MNYLFKKIISLRLWNSLDIQFSKMLINLVFSNNQNNNHKQNNIKKIALTLASACLSAHVRSGHTCLPLDILSSDKLFQGYYPKLAYEVTQKIGKLSIDNWGEILSSLSAVNDGSCISPLVLDNQCLYLYQMWKDECTVAHFFNFPYNHLNTIKKKIIDILNKLFPKSISKINWHKIATTLSLIHPRVLISGGPGTGKTSTVSQIITALLLYNNKLCIKIATPTGKSATILTHLCHKILNNFNQLDNLNDIPLKLKATTIHNLLGLQLYTNHYKHNHLDNLSNIDYLIIDEASMISLSILARLITVLPDNIKVIFVGDHHQLCSIEPGSVFKDICQFSNFQYSILRQTELIELTNCLFPNTNNHNIQHNYNNITDGMCIFKKNYRFNENSGIGQLAQSINSGNYNKALSILNSKKYTDLFYIHLTEKKDYTTMIIDCALKYYKYLKKIKCNQISIANILKIFNHYRILCTVRHGLFGTIKLNQYIEYILNDNGLIMLNSSKNYIGRPIIILQNDPLLGLCNGDIGIMLPNSHNQLSAHFLLPEKKIKIIQINQLPNYETCFAITVHKAQGSSFQHISIILPDQYTPILTRELLYTAVTRAQQKVTLYATDNVLIQTINIITQRYSRLFDRIKTLINLN